MKKLLKIVLAVICIILVAVIGLVGFLSLTEYKPEDEEVLTLQGETSLIFDGDSLDIVSWNIGYGALGETASFFMDGGDDVYTATKEEVEKNVQAITSKLNELDPDVLFLQEVDQNSDRSYHINELSYLQDNLNSQYVSTFANNFKVSFVPYPIPPIGKVDSGIALFSKYSLTDATRIQLPIPFVWPISTANLKRCLVVSHMPIENSDKQLVLINVHLEAYDDGEGKLAQTKQLAEIMQKEVDAGNYVIAGGDFNQIFSNIDRSDYPTLEGKWHAGEVDVSMFRDDFQFVMDNSTPTCRSLDQAISEATSLSATDFQYYVIDGFIVSNNIEIKSLETIDLGFENSDHNPVHMQVVLK